MIPPVFYKWFVVSIPFLQWLSPVGQQLFLCHLSSKSQVLESRALYNLGNVYHARGKHASMCNTGGSQQEVEDFVRASLEQAARHYE